MQQSCSRLTVGESLHQERYPRFLGQNLLLHKPGDQAQCVTLYHERLCRINLIIIDVKRGAAGWDKRIVCNHTECRNSDVPCKSSRIYRINLKLSSKLSAIDRIARILVVIG